MRNFIANSNETLKIEALEDVCFRKTFVIPDVPDFFRYKSVVRNISENHGFYFYSKDSLELYGFLSGIGKQENPLIDVSYSAVWFNSNLGGVYLIGYDKMRKELFAPIYKYNKK